MSHYATLVVELTILALAIFLGVEVISKVPTLLHTPLMSGTNAIHGIVIVGAMIVLGQPDKSTFTWVVGFAAVGDIGISPQTPEPTSGAPSCCARTSWTRLP